MLNELLQKMANGTIYREEEPLLTKEAQDSIVKIAKATLYDYIDGQDEYERVYPKIVKEATEILEKLSEEDQRQADICYAFGKGMAYGEAINKQAAPDEFYNIQYQVLVDNGFEKLAEEVDDALRSVAPEEEEAVSELEQAKEVATEAAAEELVENAGGIKEVEKDKNLAAEIKEVSEAVGEEVASTLAEASASAIE